MSEWIGPGSEGRGDVEQHARITVADGVVIVTMSRPAKLNAISPDITAALWEAVRLLALREDVRVMLIEATGRYFTAGIDLAALPADRSDGRLASDRDYRRDYREHHLLYDEMEATEKPIVLAAQGPCLGAGVEMAVSCDFRLASADAHFRLPEVELAVLPGSGGCSRLTRLVGPHWAKWMALAGRRVEAVQAERIGLVHQVFPAEDFADEARRFARDLAALPSEAVGLGKLVIDMAAETDRATGRRIERLANSGLDGSPAFQSATARFAVPSGSHSREGASE
jgi:enoyl-CoA hydratase/carnithine racemase